MNYHKHYIKREHKYIPKMYAPIDIVFERGEGIWLWDVEGKKYLDMICGVSASNFGHCNPELIEATHKACKTIFNPSKFLYSKYQGELAEKICKLSGYEQTIFMNSGSEAVETAIKAVRSWGYKNKNISKNSAEIIVANQNFHGRTTTIISFSNHKIHKDNFGPFTPGFVNIPFGDDKALASSITSNTVAFLVEPIQGEAGIIIPPKGYLKSCYEICKRNNVLLIVDEIQSGIGRTGKLFAFEHENIKPHGALLGKSLGGGIIPISAFLSSKEIMDVFTTGSHGSTYGGNPIACMIALKSLEILERDQLNKNSEELGILLEKSLIPYKKYPWIKNIRVKGLWFALEIVHPNITLFDCCKLFIQNSILCKNTHNNTIRFLPALNITKKELLWGIDRIKYVLEEINKI